MADWKSTEAVSEGSSAASPTSEETGMFGTKYVGAHRALEPEEDIATPSNINRVVTSKWKRRILVPASAVAITVLGLGSAAFAEPVPVVRGDTFSQLVREHCGTGDWESVAFPGRDKNKIYAGETIDITCSGAAPASTPAAAPTNIAPVGGAQVSAWLTGYSGAGDDNSCGGQGGNCIAFPKSDGFPTKHNVAGGVGTFGDPITMAISQGEWKEGKYKPGQVIYVPFVQKYFIAEDYCGNKDNPDCSAKANHFDLWTGDNGSDACMNKVTGSHTAVINPGDNYLVDQGPIDTKGCKTFDDTVRTVAVVQTPTTPVPVPDQPRPQAPAVQQQVWFHPVPGRCPSTNTGYNGGAYGAGRSYGHHEGQDFAAASGTPIHAIGGGTIISAGYHGSAGNQIQMRIGDLVVKYNHLSSFKRTSGWVSPDEIIGYVGATGHATGPHLHIEVWRNGGDINPVNFLASVGVNVRC